MLNKSLLQNGAHHRGGCDQLDTPTLSRRVNPGRCGRTKDMVLHMHVFGAGQGVPGVRCPAEGAEDSLQMVADGKHAGAGVAALITVLRGKRDRLVKNIFSC